MAYYDFSAVAGNGWKGAASAGPTVTNAYANVPAAGNLLICYAYKLNSGTATANITDDMTDGGSWVALFSPYTATRIFFGWYKIVGASANSNKTITVTPATSVSVTCAAVEYTKAGGTITLDSTPTTADNAGSANPAPGAISTAAKGLVVGWTSNGTGGATAGSGFTRRLDYLAGIDGDDFEDQFTTVSGSYNANWTLGSTRWFATGAAFVAQDAGVNQGLLIYSTTQ